MAGIAFDSFDFGLDVRRGAATSAPNRLREMTNCYVTTGKEIKKRPGLRLIATLEAGTKGLRAGLGQLNTFYGSGTITHANTLFKANKVARASGNQTVTRVWYCDAFNGFLYTSIEYADGGVVHHYLNGGGTTYIADANCPHGKGVTKAASKIWGTKGAAPYNVVRFSKTDDPTNWTAAGDAGFLSVGLKQENAQDCQALGQFQNQLVCFFQDSAQLWAVDTNPANNTLEQRIFGVGTRYAQSPASFADDVFFLADQGIRSITVNQQSSSLQDSDIGSPIDALVKPAIAAATPVGQYIAPLGQFWLVIGSRVFVYTFSRGAKLAAWSQYEFPFQLDDVTVLDNIVYVRNGDNVYKFDETYYVDGTTPIKVSVVFPFLDFKKPGLLKIIQSMDAVITGSASFSMKTDGNDTGVETPAFIVQGDSRSGAAVPVEVCAAAVAPVFKHALNEPFTLTAMTFAFENLGPL
jgi:hypothetical protein